MVLVYLKGADCIEVEAAVQARVINGNLLCFDRREAVVATFPAADVQTFTNDPQLAEAIADVGSPGTELEFAL